MDAEPVCRRWLYTVIDCELSSVDKQLVLGQLLSTGAVSLSSTSPSDRVLAGRHALLLAVVVGDGTLVEWLLQQGADVNQSVDAAYHVDSICPTALHQACFDGRLDLVQILVTESRTVCDVNSANSRQQTSLHLAVQSANADLVDYMCTCLPGCHVNAVDTSGNNALHTLAASAGSPCWLAATATTAADGVNNMVDVLVRCGVELELVNRLGFTPLQLATLLGNETCARRLLKHHDITTSDSISVCDHRLRLSAVDTQSSASLTTASLPSTSPHRSPPLTITVLLRQLMSRSSRQMQQRLHVNGAGSHGFTPLYSACAAGNFPVARLLLEDCGADPDWPSIRRHVLPIKAAVLRNDADLVELLLIHGASACHCVDCARTVLLHRRGGGTGGGSVGPASVGVHDGAERDLLQLAVHTDWPVCRLLVAGGTCVSMETQSALADAVVRQDQAALELLLLLLEAGNHRSAVRQVLEVSVVTSSPPRDVTVMSQLDTLAMVLRQPDSLQACCRAAVRNQLKPKVLWAVRQLPIPDQLKRFIMLR